MIADVKYNEDGKTVCVKEHGVEVFINVENIRYVDTHKNYLICHLNNGVQVRERKALYKFAEENPCELFLQVNKGCIVNLKFVEAIKNRRVWMCSGENFGMRRGWEREIKQRYFTYKMRMEINGV